MPPTHLLDPLDATDVLGTAAQTNPVSARPSLSVVEFQAQSLVLDPAVPLGLATTATIAFRPL